ncbi:MAG: hypothetical protein WC415_06060 [Patescibacteria group bacterium]|jgi:hypothetical protein
MAQVQNFKTFNNRSDAKKWGESKTKKRLGGMKVLNYRIENIYTPKGKRRIPLGSQSDKYIVWIT